VDLSSSQNVNVCQRVNEFSRCCSITTMYSLYLVVLPYGPYVLECPMKTLMDPI
jgi:hypothetical protein